MKYVTNKESNYFFQKVATSNEQVMLLKAEWLKSLVAPQDDMWESFRNHAVHWTVKHASKTIGYACVDETNQLLQYYITPESAAHGESSFRSFLQQTSITQGMVGTNNPSYLSIALNFVKRLQVHTCLFSNSLKVDITEKDGNLKACQLEDHTRVVDFCHYAMGAPKEWLTPYIGDLIHKKEIYVFENNQDIIGTCEVRKSSSNTAVADIGMVVSPDYRRKGYGTYLLNCAKNIALDWGKQAICSCEKENIGSLKAIQHCGFVSHFQLLDIDFKVEDIDI